MQRLTTQDEFLAFVDRAFGDGKGLVFMPLAQKWKAKIPCDDSPDSLSLAHHRGFS